MPANVPELVLYDFPADPQLPGYPTFSPFVLEVHRALALAKLPYRHERVPYQKIKRLNATGQLPVLGVGHERIADSTAILLYLEHYRCACSCFSMAKR